MKGSLTLPIGENGPRISFFLTSLAGGGAERMFVALANHFARKGRPVDLVLVRKKGPFLPLVSPQVRLVELGAAWNLLAFPALLFYLYRERPRVLLSGLLPTNLMACLAKLLGPRGTRVIVSLRNMDDLKIQGMRNPFLRSFYGLLYTRLLGRADTLIPVSEGIRDRYLIPRGIPSKKITVIHNPSFTPQILKAAREPIREAWFKKAPGPFLLCVGRLEEHKDQAILLRAYASAKGLGGSRLVLLGEGPQRRALEVLAKELGIQDRVLVPGFVANPWKFLRRARVLALPSRYEGFPNVLVEALACGTPVVSTDCPSGPREILEGGKWGRLVPIGNVPALRKAILRAWRDPRGKGRKRAWDFTLEKAAEGYSRVIDGEERTEPLRGSRRYGTDASPRRRGRSGR